MKRQAVFLLILSLPVLAWPQTATLVVPQDHTEGIMAVAFSHDGQLLLTGSGDKTVKLWNLRGQLLQTFTSSAEGEYYGVGAVAFSQDDAYVIALTTDGYADIWDLYGNKIPLFEGRSYQSVLCPECPNCSPEGGPYFLTHRREGSLTLVNINRDTLLSIEAPDTRPVAFSPACLNCTYRNEYAFLTVSSSERATLYNLEGDTLQHFTFPGLQGAGFTPDGRYIYLRNEAGKLSLVDRQGQTALSLELPGLSAVHFAPACPDCPSQDGPALLTGQNDGSIRLFNLKGEEQQVFQEPGWKDLGFAPACTSCPYGNGKFILIAGKEDTIRIIDLQGNEKAAFATPHTSADFSFDGQRLLTHTSSGYNGTASVWNIKGALLQEIAYKNPAGLYAGFKPGGYLFLKTIQYEDNSFRNIYWDMESHHQQEPVYREGEFFLSFSPDGLLALSLGLNSKAVYLRNLQGELIREFEADKWKNLKFSSDGQSLYAISHDDTESSDDSGGKVSATVWGLSGHEQMVGFKNVWQNGESYQLLSSMGNFLLFGDGEDRGSLASLFKKGVGDITPLDSFYFYTDGHVASFAPDEQSILFGLGDGSAQWRSLDGSLIRELKGGHTGALNSTAISEDNRFALTASNDGARLWNLESGEELATIIPDGHKDWVCMTPNGLFDASPGAMELMYFSFGREVIELEQLKERYYEPGLLDKLLGFSDEPIRSVEGFDTIALYPTVSLQLDTPTNQLQIELSPRNGGLGKVSVFINGKEIIEDANPPQGFERKRSTTLNINLAFYRRYFLQDSLSIVSVRAYNAAGWLKSPAHTVSYRPRFALSKGTGNNKAPSATFLQAARDPALYAILIGTANYAGDKLDLKYPDKDAEAMASAIQQAGRQLFGADSVMALLFTTEAADPAKRPSKANIRQAFETIKARAKAEDVLLVYLSGHGVTYGDAERAQFYYLTQEIASENLSDEGVRTTRAISSGELTKWINDIPAQKQVMILDACNSGKVVEVLESGTKSLNSSQIRALDRMKDRTGMFVLAGSAADKVSYEASQYGQGLLTYSILQAMSGFKLRNGKYVDVSLMFEYARDEVPKMAESIGGVQTPTMLTPGSGSIDIGIVNEQVHIPLSAKKPVFIRNVFLEENAYDDVLGLARQFEVYLQDISTKGAEASLIYVDVPNYKEAYSIKGFYRIQENQVSLRARLFRGNTPLGDMQAEGVEGDLNALVEKILMQAFRILEK